MTVRHMFPVILFLVLLSYAHADCGCGQRCQKYTNEMQCGRCCTATVRRSAPLFEDYEKQEESTSLNDKLQTTRKRSMAELSSILSLLEQKERRSTSRRVRAELHRTRQRLEKYSKVRYGDLINQPNTEQKINDDEQEMYDVLERILRRLALQHQQNELDEPRLDKRSIDDSRLRRTSESRLSQLFNL